MSSTSILEPVEADPTLDRDSNATRHLSAGAYLDETFCLSALREVYCQPKRIVAPCYGYDAITVLGHCLPARRGWCACSRRAFPGSSRTRSPRASASFRRRPSPRNRSAITSVTTSKT